MLLVYVWLCVRVCVNENRYADKGNRREGWDGKKWRGGRIWSDSKVTLHDCLTDNCLSVCVFVFSLGCLCVCVLSVACVLCASVWILYCVVCVCTCYQSPTQTYIHALFVSRKFSQNEIMWKSEIVLFYNFDDACEILKKWKEKNKLFPVIFSILITQVITYVRTYVRSMVFFSFLFSFCYAHNIIHSFVFVCCTVHLLNLNSFSFRDFSILHGFRVFFHF